jgi:spermidine synthase
VLLYGLFFLSGISWLMYEVVWVRMLPHILGSTIFATSTVLAVFMAGLALGSFLIGRWADCFKNPLLCLRWTCPTRRRASCWRG